MEPRNYQTEALNGSLSMQLSLIGLDNLDFDSGVALASAGLA